MNVLPIARAAAEDRWSEVLDGALPLWRQTRDSRLAALIRHASACALDGFKVREGRSSAEFQAVWLQMAEHDPSSVATGWLAAHLTRKVPIEAMDWTSDRPWIAQELHHLLARIERLEARGWDPRVADAALTVLEQGRYIGYDDSELAIVYAPLLRLVEQVPDPDVLERLRKLGETPRSRSSTVRDWMVRFVPATLSRLEQQPTRPLANEVWAPLAAWLPSASPPPVIDTSALVAEVYANPHDDRIRAVLADAWLQEGNPRGSFVALQLEGHPDDAPEPRRLLLRHRAEWLGDDLSATLETPRFRRGFLHETGLRSPSNADRHVWRRAALDRRLSTLRVLRPGRGNLELYHTFLTSPATRGLRRILVSNGTLAALANAEPRSLEVLELGRLPAAKTLGGLLTQPMYDRVDTLSILMDIRLDVLLRRIKQAGWEGRLRHLEFWADHGRSTPWLRRLPDALAFPGLKTAVLRSPNLDLVLHADGTHLEIRLHSARMPHAVMFGYAGEWHSLWPEQASGSGAPHPVRLIRGVERVSLSGVHIEGLAQVLASEWEVEVGQRHE